MEDAEVNREQRKRRRDEPNQRSYTSADNDDGGEGGEICEESRGRSVSVEEMLNIILAQSTERSRKGWCRP